MELDKLPTDVCFRGGLGSVIQALMQKDRERQKEEMKGEKCMAGSW